MRLTTHQHTALGHTTTLEKIASLVFVVIHGFWALICSVAFLNFLIAPEGYPGENANLALFALFLMSPSLIFLFMKEKGAPRRPHGTWGETLFTCLIVWTLSNFLKGLF